MSSKKNITRYISVIVIVGVLFLLSMYSFGVFGLGGKTEFKNEYKENITSNNLYKYINQYDVLEFLDHGTGVLYLGYPESPWCTKVVSVLNEAAFSNGLDKIYYYNIKKDRNSLSLNDDGTISIDANATNFYNELLKELTGFTSKYYLEDSEGNKIDTGYMRIYVPFVVFVRDGEVVFAHADVVDSYTDINKSLNQDQWDELYNIYEKGINLVKKNEEA